jgi:hypothetical protein
MFLRNYDNILTAFQLGRSAVTDINVFGNGSLNIKSTSGDIGGISENYSGTSTFSGGLFGFYYSDHYNSYNYGLVCGNGTSDCLGNFGVNYDDYKLQNRFTTDDLTGVSQESEEVTYDEVTHTYKRTIKKSFKALIDLEIKEIGTYISTPQGTILTYREVLVNNEEEQGILVEEGQFFTISLTTEVVGNTNQPVATVTVGEQ